MSKRTLLIVLLTLSLTGNAALVFKLRRPVASPVGGSGGIAAAADRPSGLNSSAAPAFAAAPAIKPGPEVGSSSAAAWAHFATRDPTTLAARMRAAGFSVAATRGAVYALLRELQNEARAHLLAQTPLEPFWKTGANPASRLAQSREIARLWQEREGIMRQLFPEEQLAHQLQLQTRFGPLPTDKLDRLEALERDYNELRMQVQMQGSGVPRMPWHRDELALLDQEMRRDLEAILSPAELEEYDLRSSRTARIMQSQLVAFAPTEEEYRKIYALRAPFDARYSTGAPSATASRQQDQRALDQAIEAALGPDRFALYQKSLDPAYSTAVNVAQRLGLAPSQADAAYELAQAAQRQLNAIRQDGTQTREQRTAAFSALLHDSNTRLSDILTPAGLQEYRNTGGFWLRNLERAATPRSSPLGP